MWGVGREGIPLLTLSALILPWIAIMVYRWIVRIGFILDVYPILAILKYYANISSIVEPILDFLNFLGHDFQGLGQHIIWNRLCGSKQGDTNGLCAWKLAGEG
ncbi:hypothetical protein VNO77_34338 [Canavalia gladiata]|uniref:Uncharacterized protein n=1 Tax=Canavalia gladiata TaxID=3824 RepID=A0AAN9KE27_CANGL